MAELDKEDHTKTDAHIIVASFTNAYPTRMHGMELCKEHGVELNYLGDNIPFAEGSYNNRRAQETANKVNGRKSIFETAKSVAFILPAVIVGGPDKTIQAYLKRVGPDIEWCELPMISGSAVTVEHIQTDRVSAKGRKLGDLVWLKIGVRSSSYIGLSTLDVVAKFQPNKEQMDEMLRGELAELRSARIAAAADQASWEEQRRKVAW